MQQLNLFINKTPDELYLLMSDLVRHGGAHSAFSKPNYDENILLLEKLKKTTSDKLKDSEIRFLALQNWYQKNVIIDDELGYKIANLGEPDALIFALNIVGAHARGRTGHSIANRVISRFSQPFINVLIKHPSFNWEKIDALQHFTILLDKKHHFSLSTVLSLEQNVFDFFKTDEDKKTVLNKVATYINNSSKSSILDFNCERIIDNIYMKEWSLDSIQHLLDDSYWGKQLRALVQERWMLENIPDSNNVITKRLKF